MPEMLSSTRVIAVLTDVFQQDSAPAHHACHTIKLRQCEAPNFVGLDL